MNRNPMKLFAAIAIPLIGIAVLLSTGIARAQADLSQWQMRMMTDADEYLFFTNDAKEVVDYKSDRLMRVCVSRNRHNVPITVLYDENEQEVMPGDCLRVEAQEVSLRPVQRLEENWMLRAEVQTLN